jgi:hypothetical protein
MGNTIFHIPLIIFFFERQPKLGREFAVRGNALQSYTAAPRRLHFITMVSWEINLKPETQISEHLSQSACTQTAITNDEKIKGR